MNYTVLVTGAAYGTQNASTAFLFCQSLIKMNHNLNSVFFYSDGVLNSSSVSQFSADEFNLIEGWQKLSSEHCIKLYVCASSAVRRGIVEDEIFLKEKIKKGNLSQYFQLSGLMELANSIKYSDRIIQF
ncbi:sulfurtransferase complex subunit TusD [Buchnera aphidicola (Melanaphis sacchari)]|uniref:Sulfurtransferase complex subunit TusD n=1 Tax=Buchnera aphidicola (Melanaphis sacchari) TaxID=2173854 RepID=A0A2U8DEL1_9GAMM|nr:sulfurtransferase complex subunit TusD [Buchnera aphidicola]AWH90286.1 sulfurtransferase complex subunit TusD [Buchnera aphidicola (Melanaphis sacchari)]